MADPHDSSAMKLGSDDGIRVAGEIIARLEAATEGYRGLDALVGISCGFGGWTLQEWDDFLSKLHPVERSESCPLNCPHYTTSLDAAMTLVPEGHVWTLNTFPEKTTGYVMDRKNRQYRCDGGGTPALALCIAALKARTPAVSPDNSPGS